MSIPNERHGSAARVSGRISQSVAVDKTIGNGSVAIAGGGGTKDNDRDRLNDNVGRSGERGETCEEKCDERVDDFHGV